MGVESGVCRECDDSARVRCDRCGRAFSRGCGQTVHTAVELALKAGYRRVPGLRVSDPMEWRCADCVPIAAVDGEK